MSSIPPRDLNLLLLGKTGNGKSSCGNSILGRREFMESDSGEACTFEVKEAWTEIQEKFTVKVIDGPGMCDTRLTSLEDVKRACENLSEIMFRCSQGFHAMLLVYKYATRFTEEEKECIKMLKGLLGENLVRDYCICILTNGNSFKMNQKKAGSEKTFMTWCKEQGGDFGELLKECQYRCVLFENLTSDLQVKESQRLELFKLVDGLRHRDVRYTNDHFQKAHSLRQRLVIEKKAPQLKEEISKQTSLLLESLNRVQNVKDDFEQVEHELRRLEHKVDKLLEEIELEDKGTDALKDLKDAVKQTQKIIERHAMKVELQKQCRLKDKEWELEIKKLSESLENVRENIFEAREKGTKWKRIGHYFLEGLKILLPIIISICLRK